MRDDINRHIRPKLVASYKTYDYVYCSNDDVEHHKQIMTNAGWNIATEGQVEVAATLQDYQRIKAGVPTRPRALGPVVRITYWRGV